MTERIRILIADDGSDPARWIGDDLVQAGLPEILDALVLSVADVWLPPPVPSEGELAVPVTPLAIERAQAAAKQKVSEMELTAARSAERLQKVFPHWHLTSEAFADSPGWGILKRAAEWRADLIVVAAAGRTGLGRLNMGSVSRQVVAEATCSVRVVRPPLAHRRPSPCLVIGLDGSEDADLAMRRVAERPWPTGTEAHLVIAIDEKVITGIFHPAPSLARWLEKTDDQPLQWVDRMLAAHQAFLTAAGLTVTIHREDGDPKSLLLQVAQRVGATSLFVGARGHRLIERILIGSVSSSILTRAECSVEVVR
jgi:nucleotide-binding universal stress UspA family protein